MKNVKLDDTEIEEYKFKPYFDKQRKILKQQYLISFLLVKTILDILLVTKMLKKIDLYAYSAQK